MKIKDERIELEKMINNVDNNIGKDAIPENITELVVNPTFSLNFKKLRKNCDNQAKKLIKNATGFVLTNEVVKENPYLSNKMKIDIISLSGMLYQLRVNEQMQETLMEEVRSGATHNRNFEVFGKLSDTIGNLNKQLLQTIEAIKSTYKDLRFDIRERENELKAIGPNQNGIVRNDKGLIALGTKELINETKKLKIGYVDKIEDIQEISPFINPPISEK